VSMAPPHRTVDPARRAMPVAEWPEGDRVRWHRAQRPAEDVLDDGGPAAAWAPRTRDNVQSGVGRFLTWLRHTGRLGDGNSVLDHLRPGPVLAYAEDLLGVNRVSSVEWRIRALQLFAQAVDPKGPWEFLGRLQAGLQQGLGRGVAPAREQRLRHSRDLMQRGQDLIARAERRRGRRSWPVDLRNGLMIALLAMRPLRLHNLVQLQVGEHLVQRQGRWWIHIPAGQVKSRRAIDVPFPDPLAPALELYLTAARPLLRARAAAGAPQETRSSLWLGTHGGPMTDRATYGMVVRQTRIGLGIPVNPHAFRRAAATSLALESPADARMAAPLLGHASFATTERSYRLALQIEAGRAYHGILEQLRGG
jgi:integrase/recombinase XerD